MGCQLSVEKALYLTVHEVGFDEADLEGWSLKEDHVACLGLVEEKWLQEVHSGLYSAPNSHPGSSYEKFLLLQKSNKEIPKSWTCVAVKIYKKPLKMLRIPRVPSDYSFPCSDTFADLMSYVSTENFKNYLIQASKKYSSTPLNGDERFQEISGEDFIHHFAKKLFNIEVIKLYKDDEPTSVMATSPESKNRFFKMDENSAELSNEQHVSGLLAIHAILESKNAYFIIEPSSPHSLQDVVWFSPSVVSTTITKPLFLLYQILKMFEAFHAFGYYCAVSSLQRILLGDCLWLQMSASDANFGSLTEKSQGKFSEIVNNSQNKPKLSLQGDESENSGKNAEWSSFEVLSPLQKLCLPQLIDMWVKKEISNFDYLMALNMIAGRRLGDPNYHPVLPWVTDFTTPNGRFRDLTKSKFRINKGDFQLDVTFKKVSGTEADDLTESPPHHVSGVLSEITYHVYLARRTPKSVLQKHVRAKWEPNEYPVNMQRLQEWTPDECIPEFYTDPTIFASIHSDLPDLGIPTWANTPEEFIRLHRKALESDYVCDHLHDWIDLTFGYKLAGSAAEKAKNVYLHLVDQHQSISNHGVVQLFEQPHPKQHRHHSMILYPSMVNLQDGLEHEMHDLSSDAQLGYVEEGQAEVKYDDELASSSWDDVDNDMKVETGEDELSGSLSLKKQKLWPRPNFPAFLRLKDSVESITDVLPTIDSLPISLPIGYGPLEEFNQVELLTKFKLQAKQNDLSVHTTKHSEVAILPRSEIPESARHKEIQNLCTMLMEMFLPAKMRLLSSDTSQKERFITAKRVFSSGKVAVPGILRDGIKTLFDEGCGFHKRHGFPPLTPELLLQQHVNILPFPPYFKQLYEFLVEFHLGNPTENNSLTIKKANGKKVAFTNTIRNVSYSSSQIETAVQHLPDLLVNLNEEGLELLISYLSPLFSSEETQLQAFLYLFDPLAASLGPKRTKKTFLKQLLRHYDARASHASVLLFHQSFLSKLIMRFGMDQFLDHFLSFIVDALNLSNKEFQLNIDAYSQDEVQGDVLEEEQIQTNGSRDKAAENTNGEGRAKDGDEQVKSDEFSVTKVECLAKNTQFSEENTEYKDPSFKNENSGPIVTKSLEQLIENKSEAESEFENSANKTEPGLKEAGICDIFSENQQSNEPKDTDSEMKFQEENSLVKNESIVDDPNMDENTVGPGYYLSSENCSSNQRHVGYKNEALFHADTELMDEAGAHHNIMDDDDDEMESIERNEVVFHKSCDDDWDAVAESDFSFERSVSFQSEHDKHDDNEDRESSEGDVDVVRELPEAAAESICWLAPRLGPLLTSNHIIKPLLGMLMKCYVGLVGMGDKGMSYGDKNAKWMLYCLAHCADIYGEAIIAHQYMPFVMSKINISSEHVSVKGEANLAGALVLVKQYVCSVSKESLVQQFSSFCYQALDQVLCLISSATISFASEAPARTSLALLIVDILTVVCDVLERVSAQDLLAPLISSFFACFELDSNKGLDEQPFFNDICKTFTASLAYNAYIPLCKCLGDTFMTATLDKNNDMIWLLCCSVDEALSNHTPSITAQSVFILSEDLALKDVEVRKDTKTASLERVVSVPVETRSKGAFVSSRQHLAGNWLKYWKRHLGKRRKLEGSSFSQLKLQTFAGHSDVVKDIHIQDSEHLFLSASRDRTVKLWLLNNHGDGTGQSACSWTTYDHRKPVFAVDVIDVTRQAVSCDGCVHIWDLPTGSSVLKLNFPKSKEAIAMATLPCPSPCLVAGMQNGRVRFIDAREGNFGHTWRVTSNNLAGHIRSLCVTQDGTTMAVGFSNGFLSLVDLRGGILTRQWKAHETEIIQVKPYTNSSFVTSSSTQKMELWGHDATSVCSLPTLTGSGESIHNIHVHDKVIISLAGNNRIAWHTFIDKEPTYSHLRLGNDVFKGNATCFGALPLNRGYLLGSENGNITLMA